MKASVFEQINEKIFALIALHLIDLHYKNGHTIKSVIRVINCAPFWFLLVFHVNIKFSRPIRKMICEGTQFCSWCFIIFGAVLVTLGIATLGGMNALITIGLQASLQVVPGSVMYDTLLDSGEDTPVYFSVWLWNYTNSEDYTYTPAKIGNGEWSFPVPYVEEVGPFVYKEVFATDQVQFKDSEGNIFSAEEVERADDKSKYISIVSHSKTQYVRL